MAGKGAPKGNQYRKGKFSNPGYIEGKSLTKAVYLDTISLCASLSTDELMERIKTKKLSVLEEAIMACYLKATLNGDFDQLDKMASRIIGKQAEVVQVDNITSEEREKRIRERSEKLIEMAKDKFAIYTTEDILKNRKG